MLCYQEVLLKFLFSKIALEKYWLASECQYGPRSGWAVADPEGV